MKLLNSLTQKNKSRGFTLVELMIVVAIIGVLAALSIYGVSKYLANAKSAEARAAIGRITKDAVAAFDREVSDSTAILPGASLGATHEICPEATLNVPASEASIAGVRYTSLEAEWSDGAGWECLRFTMQGPQYFMYSYDQDGSQTAAGGSFSAQAFGDLDGDGVTSSYTLGGTIAADGASGALAIAMQSGIVEASPEE